MLASGASERTVKRRIGEARRLEACIESVRKKDGRYEFRLKNKTAVQSRTMRWLDLERSRSLIAAPLLDAD
jgi:hypothetical protein